jgi:uncharacterized protein YeaO (DUF488 family)
MTSPEVSLSRPAVRVRRVYDPPEADDGYRVLVDRLWPRGLRRDEAHLDEWCKQIAPSTELRKWYGHDPQRCEEFGRRYRAELDAGEGADAVRRIRGLAGSQPVTLLTATRELEISGAAVLAAYLRG